MKRSVNTRESDARTPGFSSPRETAIFSGGRFSRFSIELPKLHACETKLVFGYAPPAPSASLYPTTNSQQNDRIRPLRKYNYLSFLRHEASSGR